jgi:hypothetical protein
VNETNWTYRMPMDLDALAADRATAERLAALSSDTGRTARSSGNLQGSAA